jgi:excisionase family DNA binding protein
MRYRAGAKTAMGCGILRSGVIYGIEVSKEVMLIQWTNVTLLDRRGITMEVSATMAAKLLGVSRATVYNMLRDGRLEALTVEALVRYVYEQGYERGREEMYEELRRARRLRRADHHCCREKGGEEKEERV